MLDRIPAVPVDDGEPCPVAATDLAQFVRLDQCERYLRLRLHGRATSDRFLSEYGVAPQSIPPLLTLAGRSFEEGVERAIAEAYPILDFRHTGKREPDNARIIEAARELAAGHSLVVLQPRLEAVVGGWRLRGELDLLRLERDDAGSLAVMIADMKSSTSARVEHRLQLAFYDTMLGEILSEAGVCRDEIALGVLYRGSNEALADPQLAEQRRDAAARFNVRDALLEVVADPDEYRAAVSDMLTGPDSTGRRVTCAEFTEIPFHLTYKCDGCLYNEFCMKWSAEHDDLSLLPHLTAQDKRALQRDGVTTTAELAALKEPVSSNGGSELRTTPGREALVGTLAATWPVGPRLDELIYRARRYQGFKQHDNSAPANLPSKGYGSLPYCDAEQNPNLVRVYLDVQHDYLQDRIYLAAAMVVACKDDKPVRRRSIVRLAESAVITDQAERDLLVPWVRQTVQAVVDLAEPDAQGERRAPIHLIVFNRFGRDLLLGGLARHFETVLGLTPLYDFMTQLAAFDSPVFTFLEDEIRELKNYPMVCQSLQSVATYLKFDWSRPHPFRRLFHERYFDYVGKLGDGDGDWYTRRSRFNSQIPLEYAYAAWGELPPAEPGARDDYGPYRHMTRDILVSFAARRLDALEHIAGDFRGNKQTQKSPFTLPDLNHFTEKARDLAQALDEFVTIERHAALAAWKSARLAPPERRVLAGNTLLVRYREDDQDVDARVKNRENLRKYRLKQQYEQGYRAANPEADKAELTKEQRHEAKWSSDGTQVKLELTVDGCDCGLDEALALSTLREGDSVLIAPRWAVDSRLPASEQVPYTPTPKSMLYKTRGVLDRIVVEREDGEPVRAHLEITLRDMYMSMPGYVFSSFLAEPFEDRALYSIDEDPNNWYAYFCSQVTGALCQNPDNPLYERLTGAVLPAPSWPDDAQAAQERFFDGLEALREYGVYEEFEGSKREYIAEHGGDPTLLVQGPPGTGKSFGTAYALLARIQGALAANLDFRVVVSCKTHAATDVLLGQLVKAQETLRLARRRHDQVFRAYFDDRVLDVPLFRVKPKGDVPAGVVALQERKAKSKDPKMAERIEAQRWCVVAATPGGVRAVVKERWNKDLLGHEVCDCLVLDEASQLSLPEAIMASMLLKRDASVIVVGDHRQMPPIVQHDWDREARRTFKEYRTYESLFNALLELHPPMVKFAESFRLHADMAEFLRREIYQQDGIPYFSKRDDLLEPRPLNDPFVAAVLESEHPLVVVVHDEAQSQVRNPFEQELITPVLEALADPRLYALDAVKGLGVVVPHRAQRAALQDALPALKEVDPQTGSVKVSAVDTVERFQGGEREVILVSATESDREYLLVSGEFLLDPRRLTVALSRAKRKMILVAARSVFQLFSADEQTFANAQLWKNLLRTTCTVPLWSGERGGNYVEVWGNAVDANAAPVNTPDLAVATASRPSSFS